MALAVLPLAVAPQPAPASTAVGDCVAGSPWGTSRPDLATGVLNLVNQHRTAIGLPALKVSARLTNSAVWKARHMAWLGYMRHDDPAPPTARTFGERLAACGYTWAAGENIAYGYGTPQSVYDAWMASSGHRSNIEGSTWKVTGVGTAASSGGTLYWTQDFGGYDDSSSTPPPASSGYRSSVVGSNPLAYWRLAESSGTTARDELGRVNGTYTGGPTLVQAGALTNDANAAAAFDGNDDAVVLSGLPVNTGAGQKTTVEFWMYWNGQELDMPFGFNGYDLLLAWGRFGFNTGNGDVYGISDAGLANRWLHVVAVFTNGGVSQDKLYLNGVQQSSSPVGTPLARSVSSTARVGSWSSSGYNFGGRLDEVAVYAGELTPSQIQAHYAAR